jgi:glyoxylase-like metal-dependent hydrolase (beta-lactamase superfamily II)
MRPASIVLRRAAVFSLGAALLCAGCAEAVPDPAGTEETTTEEESLLADRSCSLLVSRDGAPLVAGFSHGVLLRSWVFVAKVDAETVLVFGTGYAPIVHAHSAWTQMSNCLDALYGTDEPKDALIVFDHWHYDHTQGYRTYNQALRSVRYFGHALDADKDGDGPISCPDLFGVPAGYARYDYPEDAPFVPLDSTSYPGASLMDAGAWSVRWCPGHTAGTVCLTHEDEDIVLASDWVNGHGVLLPCGNDDPSTGWTGDSERCNHNPSLAATDCLGQSRELVLAYETRCNAHGRASTPCCGWPHPETGTFVTDCE